jgi:hypothetical protein
MPKNAEVKAAIENLTFTGDVTVDNEKVALLQRLKNAAAGDDGDFRQAVYDDCPGLGLTLDAADNSVLLGDGNAADNFLVADDTQGLNTDINFLKALAIKQHRLLYVLHHLKADADDTRARALADAPDNETVRGLSGNDDLTDADCALLKQNAIAKINELRLAEQLATIAGYTNADLADLQALTAQSTPAALRAHLQATNAGFNHLTDPQATQIIDAARTKLGALRGTLGARDLANLDARPFLRDAEAAVAAALVDRDAANAARDAAALSLQNTPEAARVIAYARGRGRRPADNDFRLHAEIETAHRLAIDAATSAEEQYQVARKALADANVALAKAANAATPESEAIAAAKSVEQLKNTAVSARQKVDEAKTAAEQYKGNAAAPDDPGTQLKRGNIFIEKNGLFGFKDEIVRSGQTPPTAATVAVNLLAIGQLGAAGGAPSFRQEKLNPGDTIHSTQKFDDTGFVIHLVQDHTGKVTDQSDLTNATEDQKAIAAIKDAKMLLTNYDEAKGNIYIRGGSPEQAKRVMAALLLLAKNADIDLGPEKIEVRVIGWDGKLGWAGGTEWGQERFINNQLGKTLRHSPLVKDELEDVEGLIEKQNALKGHYKAAARPPGAPGAAAPAVNPDSEMPVGLEHTGRRI